MSKRLDRFNYVAGIVAKHIEEYTVPQYGDEGEDRLTTMKVYNCFQDIDKYVARKDGRERAEGHHKKDVLKMMHLLAEIYIKMGEEERAEEIDYVVTGEVVDGTGPNMGLHFQRDARGPVL